ncbi:MAG: hypothetical protein MJD61_19690 [Proteobacteria bacterium]|nr:hypothetical protein [Pseudomonadota bacterium]
MTGKRLSGSVLLAAFALTTGVLAQAGGTEGSANEQRELDVRQRASLSGAEQVKEAGRLLQRADRIARRVASMLDEARRERDIIRVTCLNDKLNQINAGMRATERRLESLRDAVKLNDDARRNHEYTVVTVLGQKFTTLEQEANQCVGEDLFETGTTQVTTVVDPATPSGESTAAPASPTVQVPFLPQPASPFM